MNDLIRAYIDSIRGDLPCPEILPFKSKDFRHDAGELADRIEALELALKNFRHLYRELKESHEWHDRRLREVERAPFFLRRKETDGIAGLRLKLRELSNTISMFLFPLPQSDQREGSSRRSRLFALMSDVPAPSADPGVRVLIDMTSTLNLDTTSGIQRVARQFCCAGATHGAVPVFLEDGQIFGYDFAKRDVVPFSIEEGEIVFWLDASWEYTEQVRGVMKLVSAFGGQNVFMLYDLIPVRLPELCGNTTTFVDWLDRCVLQSDAVICISKAVADDFLAYTAGRDSHLRYVGWSHLGCELPGGIRDEVSGEVRSLPFDEAPFFLSVSTVEPRKGYSVALDAFDQIWASGHEACYVIVGRYGWSQESVKQRILNHPRLGKNLFWYDDASDAVLAHLYEKSRALILPSISEGFGLPLVEAASHGLPALASDLPVFREIAGDQADYFEIGNAKDLADCIVNASRMAKNKPNISLDSWDASALRTLQMIRLGDYQHALQVNEILTREAARAY